MVADQLNVVHISGESLFGVKGGKKVRPFLFFGTENDETCCTLLARFTLKI